MVTLWAWPCGRLVRVGFAIDCFVIPLLGAIGEDLGCGLTDELPDADRFTDELEGLFGAQIANPTRRPARFHDDQITFRLLEERTDGQSVCGDINELVFASFGVKKAVHGIELTEVESENDHVCIVHWVWGWSIETDIRFGYNSD